MKISIIFQSVVVFITGVFGAWDYSLTILCVCMILDYVSGLIAAGYNKKLDSRVGFKGILKKIAIFVIVLCAAILDKLTGTGGTTIRNIVAIFYSANELLSIIENLGETGIKIPEKITELLAQLKK